MAYRSFSGAAPRRDRGKGIPITARGVRDEVRQGSSTPVTPLMLMTTPSTVENCVSVASICPRISVVSKAPPAWALSSSEKSA